MINSYYTILKMSIFLNKEISGKKLIQIISDIHHRIFIMFEHGAIIANIGQGQNYIYWQGNLKKKPIPHFSKFNEVWENKVNHLFIENNERVINLFFENGKILKLFLFPPYNNAILNYKNDILECYFENKKEKFFDIYTSKYSGVRNTLLLTALKNNQEKMIAEFLADNYPAMTQKIILTEIKKRLNISSLELLIQKLNPAQILEIQKLISELNSSIIILTKVEHPYPKFTDFYPFIPCANEEKKDIEYFDNINIASQIYINSARKVFEFEKLHQKVTIVLKTKLKYFKNTLKKLNTQLRQAGKREKYIQQANLILWNLSEIEKGDTEKELTDYNSSDLSKIKVKLNTKMTPKENAEYLFKKAKKLEDLSRVKKRISSTNKSLKLYSQLDEDLGSIIEIKTLNGFVKKIKNLGVEFNEKQNSKNIFEKRKIYREYFYNTFLIRVGKSAHESDELTFKTSKKWDWFFHAQGVTGSHVVVSNVEGKKLEYLPPEILNVAGVVAAYYSNAKNSSYVPVQYTQIRYLRKSKGSPAGLVIFNQYKSIFAEPGDFQKLDFE